MSETLETQKVKTNIGEIIKIVALTIAGVSAWYNIKTDIRDYAGKQELNQKVTEIRISTIELRLTQIETEQKELKKQREAEIQKQLDRKNENVYR